MTIHSMTDAEITAALLGRDPEVTKAFLYVGCYPLFKSVYDKYYTDCETVIEFINQIYLFIMLPRPSTGVAKLSQFSFRCTLMMWLKIVTENYCRQLFARRGNIFTESIDDEDRNNYKTESLGETEPGDFAAEDLRKVLGLMPSERYRSLIEYRYIGELSNEETAALLGLTMANYYNAHKRAKDQFSDALRKEGLLPPPRPDKGSGARKNKSKAPK